MRKKTVPTAEDAKAGDACGCPAGDEGTEKRGRGSACVAPRGAAAGAAGASGAEAKAGDACGCPAGDEGMEERAPRGAAAGASDADAEAPADAAAGAVMISDVGTALMARALERLRERAELEDREGRDPAAVVSPREMEQYAKAASALLELKKSAAEWAASSGAGAGAGNSGGAAGAAGAAGAGDGYTVRMDDAARRYAQ